MSATFADAEHEEALDGQLTLGTTSLLSIFFGLVLVCAIFFGFGYSFGRRSYMQSSAAQTSAGQTRSSSKPTPTVATATPAPQPQPQAMILPAITLPSLRTVPDKVTVATAPLQSIRSVAASRLPDASLPKPSAIHPAIEQVADSAPATPRPASPAHVLPIDVPSNPPAHPSTPGVYTLPFDVPSHSSSSPHMSAGGQVGSSEPHQSLVVQVAAMSRQQDAEVLASTLRKQGFTVSIHTGAQDSLYHVQVGPYNRDAAAAARQRLIADGYKAILK